MKYFAREGDSIYNAIEYVLEELEDNREDSGLLEFKGIQVWVYRGSIPEDIVEKWDLISALNKFKLP